MFISFSRTPSHCMECERHAPSLFISHNIYHSLSRSFSIFNTLVHSVTLPSLSPLSIRSLPLFIPFGLVLSIYVSMTL